MGVIKNNCSTGVEFLSMVLDFKFDVPCDVQWNLLRFSATTDLNRIFGSELKNEKVARSGQ